jgi:hypothetical protein
MLEEQANSLSYFYQPGFGFELKITGIKSRVSCQLAFCVTGFGFELKITRINSRVSCQLAFVKG